MKTILTSFLLLICISMFGAVPIISYSGGAKVFVAGSAITPLTPTNTGDPVTSPATVTTVAALGGQAQTLAFNAAKTILYAPLSNKHFVQQITMPSTVATLAGVTSTTGSFADAKGTAAGFNTPNGVAVHPTTGDIYIADQANNRIRKITTSGVVTTFAGTATASSVDGAIATATFSAPKALIFDADGTLYVLANNIIRKIDASGTTVSTIATSVGNNAWNFAYSKGYFYVTEVSGNKIKKISITTGISTVLAGSGVASSLDGTGTAATFNGPRGIAVDDYGFVYVNDNSANKIRRIDPSGVVTTFAGSGTNATTDGIGTASAFRSNAGLTFDGSGNLYVGDAGASNIRKVTVNPYIISPTLPAGLIFDGTTGTISGTPTANSTATDYTITATNASGSGTTTVNIATVYTPNISYTGSPLTYTVNSAITPLTPTNTGGVVPATTYGTVTTAVASAGGQPHGMAFNSDYSLMYTGLKNVYRVGKVTMSAGTSATLAGTGAAGDVNGTGTAASFGVLSGTTALGPYGAAVHPTTGDIYVADMGNNTIRKVTISGVVTTYAGISGTASSVDGAIASATFSSPACLAFDTDGSLYVLQTGSSKIRKINAAGTTVSTIASNIGTSTYHFAYSNGYFYVAETGSSSYIYKVALADGTKTTLAGSGAGAYADGTGTGASFSNPRGIVVDGSGNVYVNDYGNNRIRMITPAEVVTTVAGNGTNTSTDGLGTVATFASPAGLSMDNTGNLYVGDAATSKIRKVVVTGYTISPALPEGLSFDATTGIISGTPTSGSASTDYTITAFNGGGSSSATVNIKTVSVPGAPTIGTATPGNGKTSVAFTAPASDGGATISSYTVTSSPDGLIGTGATSPITVSGLINTQAYTFSVTATNSVGTSSASSTSNEVTPHATDYIVNVSSPTLNISALTLTPVSDVVVANDAELTINQTTTINSLTVAAGGMVTNTSTLNTPTLILNSNGTDGTGTYINTGTSNITTLTANQYLGTTRNWYVSSPVVSTASSTSNIAAYYEYIEAGDNSGFASQAANSSLFWKGYTPGATFMEAGKGYIALPNASSAAISFSGTMNTGDVSIPLSKSLAGYNLIGNPYPCHLTWTEAFATANASKIYPTIWVRTNSGSSNSGGWSFNTYNALVGETVPSWANVVIAPMQAFWVKAKIADQTLVINSDLLKSHQASNPLKAPAAKKTDRQRVRLQVSNGTATDEALIYFDASASTAFDDYDSQKYAESASATQIYSKIGDEKLVINGMNALVLDTPIPVGFVPGSATEFSIKANELSNIPVGVKVILKDNATQAETDLTDGTATYDFSPATTIAERFSLIFRSVGVSTDIKNTNNLNAQVYVNAANQIAIIAPEKSSYSIYNAVSMLMDNGQTTASPQIVKFKLQTGVYVVRVTGEGRELTTRVIVK